MATATQTFHVDTGGGQTVDVTVTYTATYDPGSGFVKDYSVCIQPPDAMGQGDWYVPAISDWVCLRLLL